MQDALHVEGNIYRGVLITKYLPLPELESALIEAVHEPSGARIIQIANNDPENLFSLSFQTLPNNSNGVAHILEHTVLCGSKRFPVKDPFFAMGRRSLNTFMNAMTGQDFTCYPASSQVEKDFYNLLDVYLDAVFYPTLKRLSFLQEGHRLAFTEAGNKESPLAIQGVVYNEMKGAMTGSDQRLWFHLFKSLTPDLPYAYNSGGDPKEIPLLSHEELVDFHRTFYHPSCCLFFFYGNLPLSKNLDFILDRVLENVEKKSLLPPLPLQPRFSLPCVVKESYPIALNEDSAKKTVVALGFLTAPISEQTDLLALSLIDSLLTDTDVSPLKLALLKSGLASSIESSIDLEMSEAPWVLVCKGCDPEAADMILKLFQSTLKDLALKGFPKESIEASLHQLEFQRTEIGGEGVPFGLTLFFRAVLAKQHGADSESALLIHSLFQDLREKLTNPDYLPSLIQRYFLKNPHFVLLTLAPDPTLEQKEAKREEDLLKEVRARLSEKEIEALFKQEQALTAYQNEVEQQSLDCLPKISLEEVPFHAKDYPLAPSKQSSLQLFHHSSFTNHIVYADLLFDLPNISPEDLSLLPFLTRSLCEVASRGRTVQETLELQQASVGELGAMLVPFIIDEENSSCEPALCLRGKALLRKAPILFDLMRDFVLSANFRDMPRIKELLLEHTTHLQNRFSKQAMAYAIQLASSGFSPLASLMNRWQGLPYYQKAVGWARSFDAGFVESLESLYQSLFGQGAPTLVLSCSKVPELGNFASSLPHRKLPEWQMNQVPFTPVEPQGRIIAAPVAFNAFAFQTVSYSDSASAPLLVATDLLENVVLHREVREKGGAYGAGASYSPATGHFHFTSYRDPHLSRTHAAFLKAIDRIASGKFSESELEEAKLGILQDLDAPLPPGQRASAAYGWHRTHRTYAKRDAYRRAIIETSKEDIAKAIETHLAKRKETGVFVSFAGEDLLKKEAKKLPFAFDILPVDAK
jgi:Zn-dependent M16 (insulinase) family peptidase